MLEKIKNFLRTNQERLTRLEEKVDTLLTEKNSVTRGPQNSAEVIEAEVKKEKKLISALCKELDFHQPWYLRWAEEIKETPRLHRKLWEFVYITQALYERGLLTNGKKALGFAVGTEPLPALFAKYGVQVTATDIDPELGEQKGWTNQDQLCYGVDTLNTKGICPQEDFAKLVSYRPVDMNNIPDDLKDYDFTWSACAFEHLGSIEHGLSFVKNQMKTLKPGGWAIHTSEYNISSNEETFETEGVVVFRQKDYRRVAEELRAEGHFVEELDFSLGWLPTDYYVDLPPFKDSPHLRLQLGKFVSSSFCLIIRKKV